MPGAENENYASEIGRESSLAPKAASHRDKALSCVSCPHRRGGGRDRTPLRKPDRVLARVFATTFSRSRAEPRWKAQNRKTQKYRRQPIAGQPAYPGNDRSLGKRVNEVLINNKEVFANLADAEGPVRTRIEIDAFFLFRAQFLGSLLPDGGLFAARQGNLITLVIHKRRGYYRLEHTVQCKCPQSRLTGRHIGSFDLCQIRLLVQSKSNAVGRYAGSSADINND
ncbi:hypothetical protein ACVIDN_002226 [Rhizobium brockwellii]